MSQFSEPKKYLYEPNAAIMKAGGFKSVGNIFGLEKLSPSSHLYTSNEINGDFPGRIFEIEDGCLPCARAMTECELGQY